jgi:hypothetical protein
MAKEFESFELFNNKLSLKLQYFKRNKKYIFKHSWLIMTPLKIL